MNPRFTCGTHRTLSRFNDEATALDKPTGEDSEDMRPVSLHQLLEGLAALTFGLLCCCVLAYIL